MYIFTYSNIDFSASYQLQVLGSQHSAGSIFFPNWTVVVAEEEYYYYYRVLRAICCQPFDGSPCKRSRPPSNFRKSKIYLHTYR